MTLLVTIFNFVRRTHLIYSLTSLYFVLILFLFPQSTSFFVASIAPFIYLPLLIFMNNSTYAFPFKKVLIFVQVIYLGAFFHFFPRVLYHSNFEQFLYIKQTSQLLTENNFSYLDGMGIFSKNKFIPCFVSPNDDFSNGFCISSINEATPDVVIVTSRLIHFGSELFTTLEKNYSQIFPNLWIKNDKITKEISDSIDLNKRPVPVLTF